MDPAFLIPPGRDSSYITKGDLYKWECSVLAYLTKIAETPSPVPKVVELSDSDSEKSTSHTDDESESDSLSSSEDSETTSKISESDSESKSVSTSGRTLVKFSGKPSYISFSKLPHYKKPKGKSCKFAWALNQSSNGRIESNTLVLTSGGTVPDAFILSKIYLPLFIPSDVSIPSMGSDDMGVGIINASWTTFSSWMGNDPDTLDYNTSGTLFHDSEQISVDEVHANDVISLEIDLTTNRIIFFCNGKLQGSGFRNIPRKVRIGVCGYGSTKFNVHFFGSIKKLSPTRSQLDALRWQSW